MDGLLPVRIAWCSATSLGRVLEPDPAGRLKKGDLVVGIVRRPPADDAVRGGPEAAATGKQLHLHGGVRASSDAWRHYNRIADNGRCGDHPGLGAKTSFS